MQKSNVMWMYKVLVNYKVLLLVVEGSCMAASPRFTSCIHESLLLLDYYLMTYIFSFLQSCIVFGIIHVVIFVCVVAE